MTSRIFLWHQAHIYLPSLITASRLVTRRGNILCSIEIEIFSVTGLVSPAVLAAAVMTLSMRIKSESELILQCSNINLAVFMSNSPQFYVDNPCPIETIGVLMFLLNVSFCCLFPPPVSPVPTASPGSGCSCLKTPGLKLKVELRHRADSGWNVSLKK